MPDEKAAAGAASSAARRLAHRTDLSLYLVTDTQLAGGSDRVPGIVAAAVRGGAGTVQIRDKDASDADVAELVRTCRAAIEHAIGREAAGHVAVFVNDRLAVAEQLRCHLHVGQSDVSPREARTVLGADLMIGLSASTTEQVQDALADGTADVLGIGPVRATATKADADAPLGIDGVRACRNLIGRDLGGRDLGGRDEGPALAPRAVAIGGVDAGNAGSVAGTGVDGICVVSAIMTARDPEAAARELLTAFRAGRAPAA